MVYSKAQGSIATVNFIYNIIGNREYIIISSPSCKQGLKQK